VVDGEFHYEIRDAVALVAKIGRAHGDSAERFLLGNSVSMELEGP
jgi:hypothetical protein